MSQFSPQPYCESDNENDFSDDESIELDDFGVEEQDYPMYSDTEPDPQTEDEQMISDEEPEELEGFGVEPYHRWEMIERNNDVEWDKFGLIQRRAKFIVNHSIHNAYDLKRWKEEIDQGFENAVKDLIVDMPPENVLTIQMTGQGVEEPFYIPPHRIKDFNRQMFWNYFNKLSQSKKEFLVSGVANIKVHIYETLKGGGRSTKVPKSYPEDKKSKTSVVTIQDRTHLCGYMAIAMGKLMKDKRIVEDKNSRDRQWKSLIEYATNQRRLAEEFCGEFNIDNSEELDIVKLIQIQNIHGIKDVYQFIVIEYKTCKQLYKGPDAAKEIYLLYDSDKKHYDLIKVMKAFIGKEFYCKHCNRGSSNANEHQCENICNFCKCQGVCEKDDDDEHKCLLCHRKFANPECLANHSRNWLCNTIKYCEKCELEYKERDGHKCNEFKCEHCRDKYVEQPHYCYVKPLKMEELKEDDSMPKIFVAFDIESMLIQKDNYIEHKPILLCYWIACTKCWDNNITNNKPNCDLCHGRKSEIYGEDCVEKFDKIIIKEVAPLANKVKGTVNVLAHNLSGYDGQWIFKDLIEKEMKNIKPIARGLKFLCIDLENVRFIDSLKYLQRPLADLNKMFDMEGALKGFFPHHYNNRENQKKQTPFRELTKDHFGYKQMSQKRANEFNEWYQKMWDANLLYDLDREMRKYCRNDVEILMKAVMKFRHLFMETQGLDPTSRCFTLPSVGSESFRATELQPNTLGVTPVKNYGNRGKNSFAGRAWLDVKQKENRNEEIIREYKVGKYYADGMICENWEPKIAFEFYGCAFHGHNCGINFDRKKAEKTKEKEDYYRRRNIQLIKIYQCEWEKYLRSNTTPQGLKNYYKRRYEYYQEMTNNGLYLPIRKALHGGRTNNLKFCHIKGNNESIEYLDVVSEYPFVLRDRPFPIGHPKVISENFENINNYFGFITAKVLPPKRLYLPVLPMNINDKLLYPLCNKCATNQNQETCNCTDEERCITSMFTSVELQKAITLGYKIIKIYQVLHYERTSDSLFKHYINRWYKKKAESSGPPPGVTTPEEIQQFADDFERHEGFALDVTKIKPNAGIRNISKMMLNSFWGKLAQAENQPETKLVIENNEIWDIFTDKRYEVLAEEPFGKPLEQEENESEEDRERRKKGQMMAINYRMKDPCDAIVKNTSVAVASFVTAWARLYLYEIMENIEESNPKSVLYFDTDSVIFVHKNGCYKPPIGAYLGQMTDEIESEFGVGAKMVEFYSLGPKTYSYKVIDANGRVFEKFKAKGITQTVESTAKVNMEVIKEKATNKANNQLSTTTKVPQMQFRITRQHDVVTKNVEKDFRVTSNKRRIVGNETLPYGYVD